MPILSPRRLGAVALALALAGGVSTAAFASMSMGEHTTMVGGAAMYPSKNIIENAVNSKDNTILVAAVKAAGLVNTLEGPGPFTVFAPTNEAFAKLPPGTVANLLQPDNKAKLVAVLSYHVVPGRLTSGDLARKVRDGGGRASLTTVEGEPLTLTRDHGRLDITDTKGRTAHVTIGNVMQSNGVIQVVDTVLLP